MRELNNGHEEDEKERKRKWLQRQRMLQDELVKLKFEMIEEGKRREDITVRSPYLESVSDRVSPIKDDNVKLRVGGEGSRRTGETPRIPKPPDLAEHIAKILEHENKIKRKRYQMKREGERSAEVSLGDSEGRKKIEDLVGVKGGSGAKKVSVSGRDSEDKKGAAIPAKGGVLFPDDSGVDGKSSTPQETTAGSGGEEEKPASLKNGTIKPPKPPAPLKLSLLRRKRIKKRKVNS